MSDVDDAGYEEAAGLPRTVSGLTSAQYIGERVAAYQEYYDSASKRAKAAHLRMRTVAVTGGVLVPVLVNIESIYARIAATVVSLVVAVAVSLESVFHYREQWKNYRSTEQTLGHERIYFETGTGVYSGLGAADAYACLVERVEEVIANENAATLNVMTHGATATGDDHARGPSFIPAQKL